MSQTPEQALRRLERAQKKLDKRAGGGSARKRKIARHMGYLRDKAFQAWLVAVPPKPEKKT